MDEPAGTTWETGPARPLLGFARPRALPLDEAVPASPAIQPPATAPAGYASPEGEALPLARIEPAPADLRDPTAPFLASAAPEPATDWRPDQPLPAGGVPESDAGPDVDPATLPRPTRPAVVPVPAGPPPARATAPPQGAAAPDVPRYPAPGSYPANPYATGPYAAGPYPPGPYPPPVGPNHSGPPYPSGPYPPPAPARASTKMRPAATAVLVLLLAAALWSGVSIGALLIAGLVALIGRTPGRAIVVLAAVIGAALFIPWNAGYIVTSQWQSSAQLLGLVAFVGVLLVFRQRQRRQLRP